MNETEQIKYLEKIIERLIVSNMHSENESSITLNFGSFIFIFEGKPENTLRNAINYFRKQIDEIMGKNKK